MHHISLLIQHLFVLNSATIQQLRESRQLLDATLDIFWPEELSNRMKDDRARNLTTKFTSNILRDFLMLRRPQTRSPTLNLSFCNSLVVKTVNVLSTSIKYQFWTLVFIRRGLYELVLCNSGETANRRASVGSLPWGNQNSVTRLRRHCFQHGDTHRALCFRVSTWSPLTWCTRRMHLWGIKQFGAVVITYFCFLFFSFVCFVCDRRKKRKPNQKQRAPGGKPSASQRSANTKNKHLY